MGWRRHVVIVAAAVAVSGAAWVVTDVAWRETGPSEYTVVRDGPEFGWFPAPPCTPPPGIRDGTYACLVVRSP